MRAVLALLLFVGLHANTAHAQQSAYALQASAEQPQMFAPDVISTDAIEYSITFSPDGKTLYFTRRASWQDHPAIYTARFTNKGWSDPEMVSFSGTYKDEYPSLSPDGSRLYFASNRPVNGDTPQDRNDIWYVEKSGNTWGEPQHMKAPISTEHIDSHPFVTSDGTLYFHSNRKNGDRNVDMYVARMKDGKYMTPEPMPFNSEVTDGEITIDPNGKFLIFYSERKGTHGKGDLYVAFRHKDEWTNISNLGDVINTTEYEWTPTISPDGRYLFYAHLVGSDSDIYQVDLHEILPALKP